MSYQLIDIKLPSTKRIVTDATPLTVDLGGVSANDASTLTVIVVVASATAGITTGNEATLELETTWDDGVSWTPVPALDIREASTGAAVVGIDGVGTFLVTLTGTSGIVAPSVRLIVTPPASESLYLSYIRKSNVGPGCITVPRAAASSSSTGPGPTTSATRVAAVLVNSVGDMTTDSIAAAQKTIATAARVYPFVGLSMGWDGTAHREIAVDTTGRTKTICEVSSAYAVVTRDFSSSGLTASTWSELITSTSAKSVRLLFTNTSGETLEVGFGAGGAEVSNFILSSAGQIDILIPASTRVSLRSVNSVSTGLLYWAALV
jgi:hypothetical protein